MANMDDEQDIFLNEFTASITARDGDDYEFVEQVVDPDTGGLTDLLGGRVGQPGVAVARELNGLAIDDFPFNARVRFRGMSLSLAVYEFDGGGVGGQSLTVEDDDSAPTYSGIHTMQFDQDDGFVITNPSAGVVKIDYGITVEDDDSVPSYSGIHTIQFDQDDGFAITNPSAGVARIDFPGGGAALSSADVDLGGSAVDLAADLPGTTDYVILTLTLPSAGDYLIIAHGWGTLDSTVDNGSYLEVKLKDETAFVGTAVKFLSNSSDGNVPAIASFSVHLLYTADGEEDITLHGLITVQESDTISIATIDDARMSYVRLGD